MDLSYNPRRRQWLLAAGGLLLSAPLLRKAVAAEAVEIELSGTANGADVWFRPRAVHIQPGQTVRWVNKDQGNVHTATAYHPDNGKPQRIPPGAKSWNSDYLMPGESFSMTFDVPGVYDYYCVPHEHAGMVGRIVVGSVDPSTTLYADTDGKLPPAALKALPPVADILEKTAID